MRVYQLARNLNVKSKDVVEKLALLKIDVAPSSKIDSLTAKKVEVLLRQPLRVEEVARVLDLSVEKFLKKLMKMKINAISHLGLLHEKELVRILKLKTLDTLKSKSLVKKSSKKNSKPKLKVLKIKPKKKRVFEVAEELGVSERSILKKLREMNYLALHRRSPVDLEMIERLKAEKYGYIDKITFKFLRFFNEIPEFLEALKEFLASKVFAIFMIIIIMAFVSVNLFSTYKIYINQKLWNVKGIPISGLTDNYQAIETIALLEIKKTGEKFPIIEEGKDESPITTSIIHKSTTITPGNEGTSILFDKQGDVSEKLSTLKGNEIFSIKDVQGNKYYYRIIPGAKLKNANQAAYKSIIRINLTDKRKIIAVLQKIE